jgi:hypothetical protein
MTAQQAKTVRDNIAYIFRVWTPQELSTGTGIKLSTVRSIKSRGIVCRENAQALADFCGFSLYELHPQAVQVVDVVCTVPAGRVSKVRRFCKELLKNG